VATQRKRKLKIDDDYSKLDQYAILLHEYYKSLRRAGFTVDNSLWLIATKDSYPDWLQDPTIENIKNHIEDEDEED
jgi:hypothetical protein